MPNAVQKYVNNKLCCLSTNIIKHDKEMKYSSENTKCLIGNDFIANVFSNMLMCEPVANDLVYYSMTIFLRWTNNVLAPTSYSGGDFSMPNDIILYSNNGNISHVIPFAGTYTASDIVEANIVLNNKLNQGINNIPEMSSTLEINETTGAGNFTVLFSNNWGTNDNPFNGEELLTSSGATFTSTYATIVSNDLITLPNSGCFTNEQLCSIKEYIDNYCKKC